MINPNAYFTVQAWMVNDLGLHGNELTLYAIIYGFSQDGRSEFVGSISYVMEWLGCSRPTAMKTIAALVNKGLIEKKLATNGIDSNSYKAVLNLAEGRQNSLPGVGKNLSGGRQNSLPGVGKNFSEGRQNSLPNNYIDNNTNNYLDKENKGDAPASPPPAPIIENDKKPVKHKHGEYANVLLTDEELTKLQKQFGRELPAYIERLSGYIASTGKKYKSHYATIRNWASRDAKQQPTRSPARGGYAGPVGPNGIPIDPTMTDLDAIF
jgi:hypothetical protein